MREERLEFRGRLPDWWFGKTKDGIPYRALSNSDWSPSIFFFYFPKKALEPRIPGPLDPC